VINKNIKKLTLTFLIFTSIPSFAVDKVIDGGAGTDSLTINYSGITSLSNFDISTSGDSIVLTDSSSNTISFRLISNLTVSSYTYTHVTTGRNRSPGDGGPTQQQAWWNATEKKLYLYGGASIPYHIWQADYSGSAGDVLIGLTKDMDVTVIGSPEGDTMSIGNTARAAYNSEAYYSGDFTIQLGAGNDVINSGHLQNGDSIDMGTGDDSVSAMFTGTWGTPTIGSANLVKLDGGAGTDTISFEEGTPAANTVLSLTTANATNFENLTGGSNAETLNGDGNANVLKGKGGADTLNGNGGNDTLDAGSGTTNDNLYGGAGNDTLIGNGGDNILDGGTGADTITSGAGSDTIVIRSGDGGSTQSDGDTVADFTDGTDSIGLDTITFGALTIDQVGSDTVIKEGSNFLTTLTGISASAITALDFQSTSTSAVTYNGTSNNDTMVGGAGSDTFNGGAGSDTLLGWGGNDTFNIRSKSGAFADVINGGAGTDTLDINYSGVTSLSDFAMTYSSSTFTLTDSSGGTVTFTGIETLIIGDYTYIHVTTGRNRSPGDGGPTQQQAWWNATEKKLYLYGGASIPYHIWQADYSGSAGDVLIGLTKDMDVTVIGSPEGDTMSIGNTARAAYNSEAYYSGDFTIQLGAGNDVINSGHLQNGDSIDMGTGDDSVSAMFTGTWGTPTIGSANLVKLDGGAGTDTISFEEGTPAANTVLSLTTANATNFENLTGGSNAETLNGDGNANVLKGKGGADTLNGNGGNDTLDAGSGTTNDNLYGGAGNDTLYGTSGDNTLDGGTGADTITSGSGSDTIVIRSGDGGSSITDADILKDFSDTNDIIGLSGLNYSDLTVEQGTGSYSSHVVVKKKDTGEFLIIIQNTSLSSINDADFSAI
jgi:Ca2+-binding RTX toxin-like protein